MALIHWVALSFLPEKSVGRAAFSSEECEDMAGGAMGARGIGCVTGDEASGENGSGEASGAGGKGGIG